MPRRTSTDHLFSIMSLAPMVIALRIPMMVAEAAAHGGSRPETLRAYSEKTAAMLEGVAAAQAEFAASGLKAWLSMLAGSVDRRAMGRAQEAALRAALIPVSRRVTANLRRLGR
jgi:hypothetical protein